MARNKLSAKAVDNAKPGRHGDGDGLWLEVSPAGAKRWVLRFTRPSDGKVSEMGLGSLSQGVSLAKAREKAQAARELRADGRDPIKERRTGRDRTRQTPTFGELADNYLAKHESSWSNDKHRFQWRHSLTTQCAPIRGVAIDELTVEHVLSVIEPIWTKTPETAERTLGRIARVFDSARPLGFVDRTAFNPATWRDNLDHILPAKKTLVRGHHPALPYALAPAFIKALRDRAGVSPLALELCILCANRSGEVLGARWGEFDLDAKIWTVPEKRMKMGEEHQIPLSPRAIEIIETALRYKISDYVFPGPSGGISSNMAMTMLLRRMEPDLKAIGFDGPITVHGFRSTFRDWCGETTDFPEELCERALAHSSGSKVRDAYQRGRLVERRRPIMEAWAEYCASAT